MDRNASNELSQAVARGEWPRARHLAAVKVAEMMEQSDSPREVKSLSLSLIQLINACEANPVNDFTDTPYTRIMREAENGGY